MKIQYHVFIFFVTATVLVHDVYAAQMSKLEERKVKMQKKILESLESFQEDKDFQAFFENLKEQAEKTGKTEKALYKNLSHQNPTRAAKTAEERALLHAVKNSNNEALAELLKQPMNVNVQDAHGLTPLMWAVIRENSYAYKKLVMAYADVEVKDNNHYTVMMQLVTLPETPMRIIMFPFLFGLIDGAVQRYINLAKSHDNIFLANILEDIVYEELLEGIKNNNPKRISLAIARGAQLADKKHFDGEPNALFFAMKQHNLRPIHSLWVGREEENELRAKHNAQLAETAQILVKAGVPLNEKNDYGETALLMAVEANNLPLVELLLDAGADENILYEELEVFRGGPSYVDQAQPKEYPKKKYLAEEHSSPEARAIFAKHRLKKKAQHAGLIAQDIIGGAVSTDVMRNVIQGYLEPSEEDLKQPEQQAQSEFEVEQKRQDENMPAFRTMPKIIKKKQCVIS